MAHCERPEIRCRRHQSIKTSENPEGLRGNLPIVAGTGCRYRCQTDRDPGRRSEGGRRGHLKIGGHMTRAQSLAFRKASICVAATLLAAAFLAFPRGAARADELSTVEVRVAGIGTGSARLR